jgi:DNA-binding MarR family transcriptional regulator
MRTAEKREPPDRAMEVLREQGLRRLLIGATRSLNGHIGAELAKRGFKNTRPGHSMLLANLDLAGNSVTEVADRANISKQSMARLAIELEEMKLITRRASEEDRRTLVLCFTTRGRALVAETIDVLDRLERDLSGEMGPDVMATMKRGLRIITEHV